MPLVSPRGPSSGRRWRYRLHAAGTVHSITHRTLQRMARVLLISRPAVRPATSPSTRPPWRRTSEWWCPDSWPRAVWATRTRARAADSRPPRPPATAACPPWRGSRWRPSCRPRRRCRGRAEVRSGQVGKARRTSQSEQPHFQNCQVKITI